jgi:hypothetical protein
MQWRHTIAKGYYQGRHNAISLLTALILTTTFTCRAIGGDENEQKYSIWGWSDTVLMFASSMLLYLQVPSASAVLLAPLPVLFAVLVDWCIRHQAHSIYCICRPR